MSTTKKDEPKREPKREPKAEPGAGTAGSSIEGLDPKQPYPEGAPAVPPTEKVPHNQQPPEE